ncbi:hypothetical protein BGZ49_007593 [Haplosporangium sp. Z 27]|nr:hypothetical protein BGZ49_007593 [Haplosporangium sp. Z 27]
MILGSPASSATIDSSQTSEIAAVASPHLNLDDLIQRLIKTPELPRNQQDEKTQALVRRDIIKQQAHEARMSPMVWFTSSLYDPSVQFGVFKNALPNRGQCDDPVGYLTSLQFPLPTLPPKKSKVRRSKEEKAQALELQAENAQHTETITAPSSVNEELKKSDTVSTEITSVGNVTKAIIPERYWTFILLGGGHFAGMIVDLAGQSSKAHGQGSHVRDIKIVVHKTFRRYTVRKKQGGAQSSNGGANSAGARVRMYNERALKLEVRELLEEWTPWIERSECVFVHAPGNNRRTLYYEGAIIPTTDRDGRLRSIPFVTRRPTLAELKRAYAELTTVKMIKNPITALGMTKSVDQEATVVFSDSPLTNAYSEHSISGHPSRLEQKTPTSVIASPDMCKLVQLVKKGRVLAMANHLSRSGIDPSGLLPISKDSEYDRRRTPTILHLAAQQGQVLVVQHLLEVLNVDPTITVANFIQRTNVKADLISTDLVEFVTQFKPKTAYEVAKNKETRDAFRRAMAKMPETWDWVGLAHVPSPLTPELEIKQQRQPQQQKDLVINEAIEKSQKPKKPVSVLVSDQDDGALEWEQRVAADREKRARAAEIRILASKQAATDDAPKPNNDHCSGCGTRLETLSPPEKFGHQQCGESRSKKPITTSK